MYFRHSSDIWSEFLELAAGVLHVKGIHRDASVAACAAQFEAVAKARLADAAEGELPEIQAWRRAFSRMGLKPTQYRSASEALLRRFRKEGTLPKIHPLIDLCNAASLAFAVPVAVFDLAKVAGHLEVRHATGDEIYVTFAGEIEHPRAAGGHLCRRGRPRPCAPLDQSSERLFGRPGRHCERVDRCRGAARRRRSRCQAARGRPADGHPRYLVR
jgi:DNA/RNA-binding domain of Phe-tRNA-synthetase-like protein